MLLVYVDTPCCSSGNFGRSEVKAHHGRSSQVLVIDIFQSLIRAYGAIHELPHADVACPWFVNAIALKLSDRRPTDQCGNAEAPLASAKQIWSLTVPDAAFFSVWIFATIVRRSRLSRSVTERGEDQGSVGAGGLRSAFPCR